MMFFWIILVVAVVWLAKNWDKIMEPGKSGKHESQTPLDILKERYAKGEISKKEFDARKKDL